jgi:glucose-1-phosphate thymidylyltransferase
MSKTLKIIIPMAGWGTRMRPQTWSKPKPLVSVAGQTALDYLIDMFKTVPVSQNIEYVFILGPYLGELQIPPFMEEHYPDIKVHYIVQAEMKGQSHALYLARQYLAGPVIVCFSDTLIETDFSFLEREKSDGVAWVKAVPDPRRFGVAEVNKDGWVTRLIEKPETMENNLALVGCYYFKSGEELMSAIEEQLQRNLPLKNEFFLADAIDIMLERHALICAEKTASWLDTGTIEATLETNRYLLEHMQTGKSAVSLASKPQTLQMPDVKINLPVYIHETAQITDSEIGPHVSIGANCKITGSRIENSIIEADCEITNTALKGSMVGRQAIVRGKGGKKALSINISDDSSIIIG